MRTPELNYLDGWKYGLLKCQNKEENRCVENWKSKKEALEHFPIADLCDDKIHFVQKNAVHNVYVLF